MRDCEIRAAAIAKLLDLIDDEIAIAEEERDDLYNTIHDLNSESNSDIEDIMKEQFGSHVPEKRNEACSFMNRKVNVIVNYLFMLRALKSSIEKKYPAPAFDDLPF